MSLLFHAVRGLSSFAVAPSSSFKASSAAYPSLPVFRPHHISLWPCLSPTSFSHLSGNDTYGYNEPPRKTTIISQSHIKIILNLICNFPLAVERFTDFQDEMCTSLRGPSFVYLTCQGHVHHLSLQAACGHLRLALQTEGSVPAARPNHPHAPSGADRGHSTLPTALATSPLFVIISP